MLLRLRRIPLSVTCFVNGDVYLPGEKTNPITLSPKLSRFLQGNEACILIILSRNSSTLWLCLCLNGCRGGLLLWLCRLGGICLLLHNSWLCLLDGHRCGRLCELLEGFGIKCATDLELFLEVTLGLILKHGYIGSGTINALSLTIPNDGLLALLLTLRACCLRLGWEKILSLGFEVLQIFHDFITSSERV